MDGKRKQFACVDAKAFYASVECVDRGLDPLTTNLVVADETRSDGTICLAVSPSLKALGVPGRPRLFEVKQRLAEIKALTGKTVPYITAMPRMARYLEVSSEIYGIYLKYLSPCDIHVYSIDESFMDLTPYLKLYGMTAHELVTTMIRDVLATQGITATGGIGTNLYLAKIAMDITAKKLPADKDGVRVAELDEMSFREKLWTHEPLTDFWQIGPGIAAHLGRMGIHTMGDLARLSLQNEEIFFREFGVDAEILIDHAWGIETCGMEADQSLQARYQVPGKRPGAAPGLFLGRGTPGSKRDDGAGGTGPGRAGLRCRGGHLICGVSDTQQRRSLQLPGTAKGQLLRAEGTSLRSRHGKAGQANGVPVPHHRSRVEAL